MKHTQALCAATLLITASPVAAQTVGDCDWRASAQAIVEPWDQNTRTFANGDVRLALIDAIEPALGAFHILVLSPPYDELGGRQCQVVSWNDSIGFAGVDWAALEPGYDPAIGLFFNVPVDVFLDGTDYATPLFLFFSLNQSTGEIATGFTAD